MNERERGVNVREGGGRVGCVGEGRGSCPNKLGESIHNYRHKTYPYCFSTCVLLAVSNGLVTHPYKLHNYWTNCF